MLNYKDFFTRLRGGDFSSVLLFDGEEEYVKDSALHQLREKVLPEGLEEMNETLLSAAASPHEIIEACETLPFLAPKRLVVVRGSALVQKLPGAAKEEGLDALLDYVSNLPEHVILLFFNRGKADRSKKLTARIEGMSGRVDFAPLSDSEKEMWLNRELKTRGKAMTKEAATLFLSRCDPLITPTLQELQKLLGYVGDRLNIEKEDIEAVIAPSVEDRLFMLFDALITGNAVSAMTILKGMQSGRDSSAVQLLTPLTLRFRQMHDYKVLKSKGTTDKEIAEISGIRSNMMWLYEKQTRAFSEGELQELLDECIQMDFELKSGKISEDAALDTVVMRLINRKNGKK